MILSPEDDSSLDAVLRRRDAFVVEQRAMDARVAAWDAAYRGSERESVDNLFRSGKSHAEVCEIMRQRRGAE